MKNKNKKLGSIFLAAVHALKESGLTPPDFRGNELEAVEKVIDTALSHYPEDAVLLKFKAQCFYQDEAYERAADFFQKLLKVQPDDPDAPSYLAYSLFNLRRYGEALPFLEKSLKDFPNEAELQFMTGFVYLQENRRSEAAALLKPLLQEPNDDILQTYSAEIATIALSGLSPDAPGPEGPAPQTP